METKQAYNFNNKHIEADNRSLYKYKNRWEFEHIVNRKQQRAGKSSFSLMQI